MNSQNSTGLQLKKDLGLNKFKHVYIQRIIGISIPIYIISFNSRYPELYISISKLKNVKTTTISRLKKASNGFDFPLFKMTPPEELNNFNDNVSGNAIIITQDLCGEKFQDKNMFE